MVISRTKGDKVLKHIESALRVQQDKTIFAMIFSMCITSTSRLSSSPSDTRTVSPPPSTNNKYERRMLQEEMQELFGESIKCAFSWLDDEIFLVSPLRGAGQEKYGDYICINVLSICERLRRLAPYNFDETRSRDVAKKLFKAIKEHKKYRMIQQLRICDVGYLTFKLSWEWMVKRVKNMLDHGIHTWAPVNLERAVVVVPRAAIDADSYADGIRSHYIRDMLTLILDYAGVAMGRSLNMTQSPSAAQQGKKEGYGYSLQSLDAVQSCFVEEQGVMTSRRNGTHLFAVKEEALGKVSSLKNVYDDLATLWSAIHEQGGQLIVYVAPVRQREYVEKCFTAAKYENWLLKSNPALICCGYRTSSSELEKLTSLWKKYQTHSKAAYLVKLGDGAGYTAEASFECAVKYTYLKSHRLAECMFNIDEILDEEGDTFVYLLKTQALIRSRMENLGSGGIVKYAKAFFGKERELALHLVQFTEVIDRACLTFLLHPVCGYLLNLCKKFTSYYEVLQRLDLKICKSKLFLCEATEVVMKKCFYLLGITPESLRVSSRITCSSMKQDISDAKENTAFEYIPLTVSDANARIKYFNDQQLPFKIQRENKARPIFNSNLFKQLSSHEQVGFGRKWIIWIRSCLDSAFASVPFNGSSTKEFKLVRGLRQGDPLSPFLFILALEALNVEILEATDNNIFKAIIVGKDKVQVPHLQFTGDGLILVEWSLSDAKNLS
ncbi:arginine--tRNA ligase, chloroplastic/mitochondrial [Tanacetum coccineum]